MSSLQQENFRQALRPEGERRLSHRIFLYWLLACGDRPFANRGDIDPGELDEDWDWCFILNVRRSTDFPYFEHLGKNLAKFSGVLLSGRGDWSATVLDKATEKFDELQKHKAPIMIEDSLTLYDGRKLLFRSIMLPLSNDQHNVEHVLGAANGKIAAD
ncbi:MAG: PAS domain-containing protein [Pseudomonadota bacterium]